MSQPDPTPQPQPTTPWGNPPQLPAPGLPGGPQVADPSGLRYDRGDLDETVPVPAGVEVIAVGTRHPGLIAVPVKDCCPDLFVGEYCDCAEFAAGLSYAPVVRPAFNLRALREAGVTAVDLDRGAA